jgi:hypothetical protein
VDTLWSKLTFSQGSGFAKRQDKLSMSLRKNSFALAEKLELAILSRTAEEHFVLAGFELEPSMG